MDSLTLHRDIVQKFREEFLSAVSPTIKHASSVSAEQRWGALFQCTISPNPDLIPLPLLASMLDLYQVSSPKQLVPKYLGNNEQWGAIVSPRVGTKTGQRIAFIEHWFVTKPEDFLHAVDTVKNLWPLPFDEIWMPISPQHRCALFIKERKDARLQECAFVANWGSACPLDPSGGIKSQFSFFTNQNLESWWQDFYQEVSRNPRVPISEGEIGSLKKGMDSCSQTGSIVNLYDKKGFAGHISWSKANEPELLIPECWNIHYVFLRSDLRGQGVSQSLYALAAQLMDLTRVPLVCARVEAENWPSLHSLEDVGAERVIEYLKVG